MSALVVRHCGPMTSLQDFGRYGWQRHGVGTSGAMDRLALAAANVLVGNPAQAPGIEFMMLGGEVTVEGGARVAVAGAPCTVMHDGRPVAPMTSVSLRGGATLTIGPAQAGVFIYLAVAGGFAVEPRLGSVSLHRRAGIGGLNGRPLAGGDRLPLRLVEAPQDDDRVLEPLPLGADAVVRVILGPQDDYFSEGGITTFLSEAYRVSADVDRMGFRLLGPKIEHSRGYNIVSDGIVTGSVQVPGDGEPIIMMADRQTTGGYPKIATVISADHRVVAQRRPGSAVRFQAIDIAEAQRVAREAARAVDDLVARVRPLRGRLPDNEDLLALNLAGAAVDGLTPSL